MNERNDDTTAIANQRIHAALLTDEGIAALSIEYSDPFDYA